MQRNIVMGSREELKAFSKFYSQFSRDCDEFYDTMYRVKVNSKNLVKSEELRAKGNLAYSKQKFETAMKLYNESLIFAPNNSNSYHVTIGNITAVLYEMARYEKCISVINNVCLTGSCPIDVQLKVTKRKAMCYSKLGDKGNMNGAVEKLMELLNEVSVSDKLKRDYSEALQNIQIRSKPEEQPPLEKLDEFNEAFEENPNFLGASSAISLKWSDSKGRCVVTNRDVEQGETLFLEKAFVIAPSLDITNIERCFHCVSLFDSIHFPCKSCTKFIYCTEKCRDDAWEESHQFECIGVQTGYLCDNPHVLLTFHGFLKGVRSNFKQLTKEELSDMTKYGSKEDNYLYYQALVTSREGGSSNLLYFYVGRFVSYLKKKTTFFSWLLERVPEYNTPIFVGGMLLKHFMQAKVNVFSLSYWQCVEHENYPSAVKKYFTGMFVSASMINHACKPNVSLQFVRDAIIVKASYNIPKGGELVFNYQPNSKKPSSFLMLSNYGFVCTCDSCKDESDFEVNSFICSLCKNAVLIECNEILECNYCRSKFNKTPYYMKAAFIEDKIYSEEPKSLRNLNIIQNEMRELFHEKHKIYLSFFRLFYKYYISKGNFEMAFVKWDEFIEIAKLHYHEFSLHNITEEYDFIIACVEKLEKIPENKIFQYMFAIQELLRMYKASRKLMLLYFFENQYKTKKADILFEKFDAKE